MTVKVKKTAGPCMAHDIRQSKRDVLPPLSLDNGQGIPPQVGSKKVDKSNLPTILRYHFTIDSFPRCRGL